MKHKINVLSISRSAPTHIPFALNTSLALLAMAPVVDLHVLSSKLTSLSSHIPILETVMEDCN